MPLARGNLVPNPVIELVYEKGQLKLDPKTGRPAQRAVDWQRPQQRLLDLDRLDKEFFDLDTFIRSLR